METSVEIPLGLVCWLALLHLPLEYIYEFYFMYLLFHYLYFWFGYILWALSAESPPKYFFKKIAKAIWSRNRCCLTDFHHILHARSCDHFQWFPHTPMPPRPLQRPKKQWFTCEGHIHSAATAWEQLQHKTIRNRDKLHWPDWPTPPHPTHHPPPPPSPPPSPPPFAKTPKATLVWGNRDLYYI